MLEFGKYLLDAMNAHRADLATRTALLQPPPFTFPSLLLPHCFRPVPLLGSDNSENPRGSASEGVQMRPAALLAVAFGNSPCQMPRPAQRICREAPLLEAKDSRPGQMPTHANLESAETHTQNKKARPECLFKTQMTVQGQLVGTLRGQESSLI